MTTPPEADRFKALAAIIETLACMYDGEADTIDARHAEAEELPVRRSAAQFRACAGHLRDALRGVFPDYDPPWVLCVIPEDCPLGPDPHPYTPPIDVTGPCCARQPWENDPDQGLAHLRRIIAVLVGQMGGRVVVELADYSQAGDVYAVQEPSKITLTLQRKP